MHAATTVRKICVCGGVLYSLVTKSSELSYKVIYAYITYNFREGFSKYGYVRILCGVYKCI